MRKWVAAFVAICIGAAVGSVWIVRNMRRAASAVEVVGTTLMGDERAAEGLILETVYELQHTFWSSVTEWTSDGPETETLYGYQPEQPRLLSPCFGCYVADDWMRADLGEKQREYWWNVYGLPISDGRAFVDLPLAEVTKYEPLRVELNVWSDVLEDAYEAEDKLNDFLRIKVPEWQLVRLSHIRRWDADLQEMQDEYEAELFQREDWYYPRVMTAYTGEKLFFGVNNRSTKGKILDFSDTPGGYGVYMMPLRKVRDLNKEKKYERETSYGDYLWDFVSVEYAIGEPGIVLSLDPTDQLCGMSQSEDMTKLFVLTFENERYVVTVIDTTSLRVLARCDLFEEDLSADLSIECHAGEDFGAFYFHSPDHLVILYPYAEDDWRPMILTGLEELDFLREFPFRSTRLACDGVRTAVFVDDPWTTSEWCYLAVFDPEKPVYAGKFSNSLGYTNRNENLASLQSVSCEDCRIRWKD